ncbi:uncharacterized protein CDAR_81 [Caerostris darwini]|uniref:Ionotropic glutamate receptor C-terminal domain-containing protein n=1 Tax=Caerostris darwini TaxID=1538125 RepID=A0AAV4TVI5_9ARAC|nr:uncharacterized protein CDAR_81 [Caerostris darwini]
MSLTYFCRSRDLNLVFGKSGREGDSDPFHTCGEICWQRLVCGEAPSSITPTSIVGKVSSYELDFLNFRTPSLSFITFCICTGILYIITHSLPCKDGVRRSYNIWFLFRTFGQQGTPSNAPARLSIRLFISSWWIFIMVILWCYAGTLTSFMTYPGRRPAVDTIEKLRHALDHHHIRYGTTTGTTYEHFLMTNMAEVDPVFATSILENPDLQVHNVAEGMDLVLKQKYAFVYMTMVLRWYAATLGSARFRRSKETFSTDAVGIAIQKCHPCKRSFDHMYEI